MNNQQTKPDNKGFATASFVIGIIVIIPLIISFVLEAFIAPLMDDPNKISGLISFLGDSLLPIAAILSLFGLSFGILGLKSSKKKHAIIGLILSIYVLLFFVLQISGLTF